MSRKKDLTGKTMGRLLAVSPLPSMAMPSGQKKSMWLCQCDCCNKTSVSAGNLSTAQVLSCGCLRNEKIGNLNLKHGLSTSSEYITWNRMLLRCGDTSHKDFKNYGGRGITVCNRWKSFENFIADMGRKPSPLHSIERERNECGYGPGNCIWATRYEQSRNHRRNKRLMFEGKVMILSDWAREVGIGKTTLSQRIFKLNWPIEKALRTAPLRGGKPIHKAEDLQ